MTGQQQQQPYTWWTPPKERIAYIVHDEDETLQSVGLSIPASFVICDACNAAVAYRPVGVIFGSYAACPVCFKKETGMTPEEAAEKDGVKLTHLSDEELEAVLLGGK